MGTELILPSEVLTGEVVDGVEFDGDLRLSNSKAGTWRRCPKQFHYKYVMGLRSKRKSLPLERGSWIHALMEAYYDPSPYSKDWRQVHKEWSRDFYNLFEDEREELGDLPIEVMRIFTSYLNRYGKEDARWNVVDVEMDEIITLPNGLRFQVIIDLIVEEPDGGLWIIDHKTVGRFMDADFMLLDAQLARYFWAAEYMGYRPLRGIIFNEVITKAPTLPKMLQDGTLEKRANISCDVYTYYREMKRHGLELEPHRNFLRKLKAQEDRWFRRTPLPKDAPLTKRLMEELYMTAREIENAEVTGSYPRSPRKECTFDCEFKTACQVELMGGDSSDIIKMRFNTRVKEHDI